MFLEDPSEQAYDQRAGLCNAGEGDLVVTTNPFDPEYLAYWEGLGFTLPHLINAGPYEPGKCLSDLIAAKQSVQSAIAELIKDPSQVSLEVFTVFPPEKQLVDILGVSPYFNAEFGEIYGHKLNFKKLCKKIGIPGLPFVELTSDTTWGDLEAALGGLSHIPTLPGFLAKGVYGTGGIAHGAMKRLHAPQDLDSLPDGEFYVEPLIEIDQEVSTHWEITDSGLVVPIGFFNQIAENTSYKGVSYPYVPLNGSEKSLETNTNILTSELAALGGLGQMCCDVIESPDGQLFWSDLNVRKGAVYYIWSAVSKLPFLSGAPFAFMHKHMNGTKLGMSFSEVQKTLGSLLEPSSSGFVLITNPGIIQWGGIDLTAVVPNGDVAHANNIFAQACKKLNLKV